jgi:hypothetical protein
MKDLGPVKTPLASEFSPGQFSAFSHLLYLLRREVQKAGQGLNVKRFIHGIVLE